MILYIFFKDGKNFAASFILEEEEETSDILIFLVESMPKHHKTRVQRPNNSLQRSTQLNIIPL